jgi:hypothetical protein
VALAACALTGWALVSVQPASAAIAFVKKGSEIIGAGSSITLTFSTASTSGDLLVATISDLNGNCFIDSITAPSGWVRAAHSCRSSVGPVEIWYRANAPSTSSVLFNTGSSGSSTRGQLSEFSGVATSSPLDQTGTANSSSASTSLTVSTPGSISGSGEVAVTAYNTSQGLTSFTATGWTVLQSDPSAGFDSNYLLSPTSGSALTETVTSSPQSTWGAVIATFKAPPCSTGSLSFGAPGTFTFPSVTLDGTDQIASNTIVLTPDDERGTGAGWNITGTSTTLTSGFPVHTMSTTATQVTAASVTAGTGNCSLPTNSIGYPLTLPAAATAPTAVKIYNAASATGTGPANVTLTFRLSVPANTFHATYTSTWTLAIVSGP